MKYIYRETTVMEADHYIAGSFEESVASVEERIQETASGTRVSYSDEHRRAEIAWWVEAGDLWDLYERVQQALEHAPGGSWPDRSKVEEVA